MSLRRNILANYLGQAYMTAVSVVMVPLYLRYLGAEAYGLVAFFALLQGLFQLLDLGLSPTLGREVTRFRGGALRDDSLWAFFRAIEGLFWLIAAVAILCSVAFSGAAARSWLKVETLDLGVVALSVALMGITVALRWVGGIYRSVVWGFEKQVWLNVFGVSVATARFVTIIPVFVYVGTSPVIFFAYQLTVSLAELGILAAKCYRTLPSRPGRVPWSVEPLRRVLRFALTIAFTSSVWVLVTQLDKLVLSRLLPLDQFGYFALAVMVAGVINLFGTPVSQALLPRLSRLAADGDNAGFLTLYRRATQWVCFVTVPLALGLACFAEPALWIWTGDRAVAAQVTPILALYALGNAMLAVASFQYYLQYAKGDLRLHLAGNVAFVVLLVPMVVWAASRFGGVGAGWVWFGQCTFFAIAWTWLVHRRLLPGIHWHWFRRDVLPVWLASVVAGLVFRTIALDPGLGRVGTACVLVLFGVAMLVAAALASPDLRALATRWLGARALGAA